VSRAYVVRLLQDGALRKIKLRECRCAHAAKAARSSKGRQRGSRGFASVSVSLTARRVEAARAPFHRLTRLSDDTHPLSASSGRHKRCSPILLARLTASNETVHLLRKDLLADVRAGRWVKL